MEPNMEPGACIVMGRPARKVPVITEAVNGTAPGNRNVMWAVIARRTTNKGTRFEHTTDLPLFYLDPRVQGITNRAHARKIAGEVLGVDTPGCNIIFDVHLV